MWLFLFSQLASFVSAPTASAETGRLLGKQHEQDGHQSNLPLKLTHGLGSQFTDPAWPEEKAVFFGLTSAVTAVAQAIMLSSPAQAAEPPVQVTAIDQQTITDTRPEIVLRLSEWPATKPLDLTADTEDLWQSIRRSFSVPDLSNDDVRKKERALLKHKVALNRILRASEPYLHYILQECTRRGLPTELALLPFVESKFNPRAHSRAQAAGLWQFIPSTGTHYELEQNDWVDQRMDLIESTRAALDYLTYLYDMHGDWHLALISYNWGEGSVLKAVREAEAKGLEPTLDHLELPLETASYVPKLQAYKNIIAYPEKYGVELPKLANKPYFSVLRHSRDIDFRELARLAGVNLNEFRLLNPGLKQPVMYAARVQTFLIPRKFEDRINRALAIYQPPKPYKVYRVRPGDTLGHIAGKFNTTVKDIQVLNSLGKRTTIKPGMSLTLPNPITASGWPT